MVDTGVLGVPGSQQTSVLDNVNPLLIVGIVLFIIPYFQSVLKFNLGGFLTGACTWLGIILIVIGALLSGIKQMNR